MRSIQFNPVKDDKLLDHFVRSHQHIRRYRQADLLSCFEIDNELELRRLLYRKLGGLGALENLIDIRSGAAVQVVDVHAVGHKPTGFYKCSPGRAVYHREPGLYREFDNRCWMSTDDGARHQHKDCVSPPLARGSECGLNILGIKNV